MRAWIPELDGLRAIAALAVVVAHFNPWLKHYYPAVDFGGKMLPVPYGVGITHIQNLTVFEMLQRIEPGNLGVVFFFSLSSFLLTHLAIHELDSSGRFQVGRFYLRRCIRIWPLYYFALFVILVLTAPTGLLPSAPGATTTPEQWTAVTQTISNYLLLVANWHQPVLSELGILWSICVEEQFYLLFPLAIWLISRFRQFAHVLFLTLLAIGYTWRGLFIVSPVNEMGLYYTTLTYADSFAFGALAAVAVARLDRLPRTVQCLLRSPWTLLVLAASVLAVGLVGDTAWWPPYGPSNVAMFGLLALVFGCVTAWFGVNSGSPWVGVLRSVPLRTLGVISYGIYIWHTLVHRLMNIRTAAIHLPAAIPAEVVLLALFCEYAAGAVCCVALSYGLIERPLLRLRTRRVSSERSFGEPEHPRWEIPWRVAAIYSGGTVLVAEALLRFGGA
jgi:peptidoglycan/LPS O-acetylase OafA/YrhL